MGSGGSKARGERRRGGGRPVPPEYMSPDTLAPEVTPKPVLATETEQAQPALVLLPPPILHPKPARSTAASEGAAAAPAAAATTAAGAAAARVPPPVAPKPNKFQTQGVDLGWIVMPTAPSPSVAGAASEDEPSTPVSPDGNVPRRHMGVPMFGGGLPPRSSSFSGNASFSSPATTRARTNSADVSAGVVAAATATTTKPSTVDAPVSKSRINPPTFHRTNGEPFRALPGSPTTTDKFIEVARPASMDSDRAPGTDPATTPTSAPSTPSLGTRAAMKSPDMARSVAAAAMAVAKASPSLNANEDSPSDPSATTSLSPLANRQPQQPKTTETPATDDQAALAPLRPPDTPQSAPASAASLPASFDDLRSDSVLSPSPKKDVARLQKGRKRPPSKAMRIYLEDDTYKAIPLSSVVVAKDIVIELIEKAHIDEKDAPSYRLYEVDPDSAAQREIADNELPLAIVLGWPDSIKANMRLYFKHKGHTASRKVGKNTLKRQKAIQPLLVRRIAYKGIVYLPDERSVEVPVTSEIMAAEIIEMVIKTVKLKSKWGLREIQGAEAPKPIDDSSHILGIPLTERTKIKKILFLNSCNPREIADDQ